MNQIYHHYSVWEDYQNGMWKKPTQKLVEKYLQKAIDFTGDDDLYGLWMIKVVESWKYSCEHNLTDETQNRKAWVGHAAACMAFGCPEAITRMAWGYLTTEQQFKANKKAEFAIDYWEKFIYMQRSKKEKKWMECNVYEAAKQRISWAFDSFEKVVCSFSGGKDSTVMTHMVMDEAIKRNRKVALFFIDWECQMKLTIDHVRSVYSEYSKHIELYWVAVPMRTWNGCSQFEPEWTAWDEKKKDIWVREKDPTSIQDTMFFPFFYEGITFEEFVPLFGKWYSENKSCCCFVGIRTQESLNRYRALSKHKSTYDNKMFTTNVVDNVWNVYPIYDWSTEDDWIYFAKSGKSYNKLYDRFYQAGLTIHQMRIDEPFGDTQARGLWLYQVIEPETWKRMVIRVSGANTANIYSNETGNVMGYRNVTLPDGHTWKTFAELILATMPQNTAEHYKNKIAVYINWFKTRGYPDGIPDESPWELESINKAPAWRRIVRTLLRNDYWCRGMGFSPTKNSAYEKYMNLMKRRREKWGLFNE